MTDAVVLQVQNYHIAVYTSEEPFEQNANPAILKKPINAQNLLLYCSTGQVGSFQKKKQSLLLFYVQRRRGAVEFWEERRVAARGNGKFSIP